MPVGYTISGIEPADLNREPVPVRLMYWGWVVELGIKAKDRDLAEGLDAFGDPLHRISEYTKKHRKSEMTPSGEGDPNAPPLTPGRKLSRTRSLLAGQAFPDRAEFYWRYDAWTGDSWSTVLTYQQEQGRDVFGISPKSLDEVRQKALGRWIKWTRSGRVVPTGLAGKKTIPAMEGAPPGPKYGRPPGKVSREFVTPSIGEVPEELISRGNWTGLQTQAELKAWMREREKAAVQARPGIDYNRILAHVWGMPEGFPEVPGVKPLVPPRAPRPKPTKPYTIEFSGNIPKDLRENHEKAIQSIPAPILKLLEEKGAKFVYAERLIDRHPELGGRRPEGWPEGTSWENVEGIYRGPLKEITIARTKKGLEDKYEVSDRQRSALYHETGHAIDYALEARSQRDDWKDAYNRDVGALDTKTKAKLSYLMQEGHRGLQETWAELFASEMGEPPGRIDVRPYFPNCTKILREELKPIAAKPKVVKEEPKVVKEEPLKTKANLTPRVFYHGSNTKFDVLRPGSWVSPDINVAREFGGKYLYKFEAVPEQEIYQISKSGRKMFFGEMYAGTVSQVMVESQEGFKYAMTKEPHKVKLIEGPE